MTEPSLGLVLADGQRWVIRGLDPEAEATVRELGRVMQLMPVEGRGRGKVCAVSGQKAARGGRGAAKGRLVCRLGPARNRLTEVLRMEQIATILAEQSLARNGLLIHGALAVRDGVGFILAGPSGVGKSTASRRLPSPWRSLSDDCVLVVRDANGRYWAHPWPTWSLLRDNGPVASWPVGQAVLLKALLFLKQSPFDRAEPVSITPATALIMESAFQLARTVVATPEGDANRAICAKYLRAAWVLAAAVPAFRFHVSLTGQFWNEIERAVPTEPRINTDGHRSGYRTRQNSECRMQNAELREEGTTADYRDGQTASAASQKAKAKSQKPKPSESATQTRERRSVPEPPRRLLSGNPESRLVRFEPRHRIFLKLVKGRRVVGSANDVLREWYVRRPSRRVVKGQAVRNRKSKVRSPKSKVESPQSQ